MFYLPDYNIGFMVFLTCHSIMPIRIFYQSRRIAEYISRRFLPYRP